MVNFQSAEKERYEIYCEGVYQEYKGMGESVFPLRAKFLKEIKGSIFRTKELGKRLEEKLKST